MARVSFSTINRAIKRGELQEVRLRQGGRGVRRYVRSDELLAWAARREKNA